MSDINRGRRFGRIVFFGLAALIIVVAGAALAAAFLYAPVGEPRKTDGYLATIDSRYVDTPLGKFHYVERGEGPPIVLIHGGGEWLYSWRGAIEQLAKTHKVYAVDLPGHGYSTLTKTDFRFDIASMTSSIETFMDAVGIQKASLAGHSWGGGWALRFAQLNPERVDKLILVDSSGFVVEDGWTWRILEVPVIGEAMMNLMGKSDAKAIYETSFNNPAQLTDADMAEHWNAGSQPLARRALMELQRNQDWSVTESDMAKVQAPTLVLWGRQDRLLSVELAERFTKSLPNATVEVFDGCGHSLVEDCPKPALDAMEKFLQ